MALRTHKHPRIQTMNKEGLVNGFLIPIYNVYDGFVSEGVQPQQVYLTVAAPRQVKGPHLHMKRWDYFTCIKGNIRIVARTADGYEEYYSGESYDFATVEVPPAVPCALQNIGNDDAYIISTPSPAWRPDDQDEHPVSFDDYEWRWD